jgi:hypothetical protein
VGLCSIWTGEQVLADKTVLSYVSSQYTEANNSITDKMTTGILERFHRTMLQIFCFTNGKMELEAGATTQQLLRTELQDTGPGIIPSDAQVFIQR